MKIYQFLFLLIIISACHAEPRNKHPQRRKNKIPQIAYKALGNDRIPVDTPLVFSSPLISHPEYWEMGCAFSPDGKEFYFSRTVRDSSHLFFMKYNAKTWSLPQKLPVPGYRYCSEPHVDKDGKRLYFSALNPDESSGVQIVYLERCDQGWSAPIVFSKGMYPGTTRSGKVFYTVPDENILRYKYSHSPDGPEVTIRFEGAEFKTGHAFVSPDEQYMIVGGFQKEGQSAGEYSDLYISWRISEDYYTTPKNLGDLINNPYSNICPTISPDGNFLFYSNKGDIYWVSFKSAS